MSSDDEDTLSVRHLQERAIQVWFAHNWRRPRPGEHAHLAERISRRKLRALLNRMLAALRLPQMCERSTLWQAWVLANVLRLDATEAASGKHVLLVPVRTVDAWRRTLDTLRAQLPVAAS
jgi:hypothetical protein